MNDFFLFYKKGSWHICINYQIVATSYSLGLHPLSMSKGDWFLSDKCIISFEFKLSVEESGPFLLEDLGLDFFSRKTLSHVIQFINPNTGEIEHSGAKEKYGKRGKRYCFLCDACISANNFVSQHNKKHKVWEKHVKHMETF